MRRMPEGGARQKAALRILAGERARRGQGGVGAEAGVDDGMPKDGGGGGEPKPAGLVSRMEDAGHGGFSGNDGARSGWIDDARTGIPSGEERCGTIERRKK